MREYALENLLNENLQLNNIKMNFNKRKEKKNMINKDSALKSRKKGRMKIRKKIQYLTMKKKTTIL